MEKQNSNKLVVVLGMHRSGTSVVTRGLRVLGVDLGNDFLPDKDDNPKGFWEDSDLNALNIEILNAVGNHWHYLAQVTRSDIDTLHKKGYFLRAVELLREKTSKAIVFGFKDPRVAKLLYFWKDVFAHCKLEVGYVLTIRHPLSVVKSLAERDGFDHEKSYFMWLEHVISSLSNSENCNRVLIDYDLLMQSPDRELNKIAKELGLSVNQSELQKYATEFLDDSLRHTIYSPNDLLLDVACPPLVHEVYSALFNVATGEAALDEAIQSKVSQWEAELERLKVPLVFIDNLYKQKDRVLQERDNSIKTLQEKEQIIKTLQEKEQIAVLQEREKAIEALQEKEQAIKALQEKEHEKDLMIQILQSKLQEKKQILEIKAREQEAAIRLLQNQIIEKDQKIQNPTGFEKQIREKEQKITLLQAQVTERNIDIKKLIEWIYDAENIITALLDSRRWKIGNMIGNVLQRITRKPEGLVTGYLTGITSQVNGLEQKYFPRPVSVGVGAPVEPIKYRETDIVICIHNALVDVKKCLGSVKEHTDVPYRLILVDDGSAKECKEYLSHFAKETPNTILIRNESASGFTKAANQGMRVSKKEYVVLLNSDTIVTPGWIKRMQECGESSKSIGIIGPLSNAASWQSIPKLMQSDGKWSLNPLPADWTPEKMAEAVNKFSARKFPRVALLNGFCLLIKRSVIEKIGYLDEANFPEGYGEENDYCLRAQDSGFELAVADHAYVYHAKTKSYSLERRLELTKRGQIALEAKYSRQRLDDSVTAIKKNPALREMRYNIEQELQPYSMGLSVLFVLPLPGIGGGSHSIIQEVEEMRKLGANAQVAVRYSFLEILHTNYPHLKETENLFFGYKDEDDLTCYAADFNVVIATVWDSVELIKKVVDKYPHILPAYYVQDYEPWFCDKESTEWTRASLSYTLIPNAVLFAKTRWLCDKVADAHGVHVEKVLPSLDKRVYYPAVPISAKVAWPVHITAMIRPSTPRRGAPRTMRVLQRIKEHFGERVRIEIFGCSESEIIQNNLEHDFEYTNYGILNREEVANILRRSDIFLDFSEFQAFGRTGLEAMACGCAVVLPAHGGVTEYADDGINGLIVNTENEDECLRAVQSLVQNAELREDIQKKAIQKSKEYSVTTAAASELAVLSEKYSRHVKKLNTPETPAPYIQTGEPANLRVIGIVARRAQGFQGSAYIRILYPLTNPSIRNDLSFSIGNIFDVYETKPDIVVVQRIAISDENEARELVSFCKSNGIKLVYETDDDLFEIAKPGSSHPEAESYAIWTKGAKVLALNADLLTVSSEPLKRKLSDLNSAIQVIPNALDEEVWQIDSLLPQIKDTTDIGILYMGTRTHGRDLAMIETALKKVKKKFGNRVRFDVIGVSSESLDSNLYNVIIPPVAEYPDFVAWLKSMAHKWSIGLTPLANTSFNECKSYIKYLDYSGLGLVSVCSKITPYEAVVQHGINGFLVENNEDSWYDALARLIEDDNLRKSVSANAYQGLIDNHKQKNRSKDWLNAMNLVINGITRER
ncbi:MAG: hypothetical protein CVU44_15520 [Chloroflexi bacterium HGW-Chloroflexi-6]|nr:MAG: hypothetical protein CVU44_15520 [Chloroflexi bacterium HGW-Chloroflexi-6]